MDKSTLGDRMKRYENAQQHFLTIRTPVIIRIDGKAFHTLTKELIKPFDDSFIMCMEYTMQKLVEDVEGCSFGYCQSDEISLLLTDYTKLETQPWFDNKLQKIVSVAASIATANFNNSYRNSFGFGLMREINKLAYFDARAFNIPKEDVVNYFLWRQQDAIRNSIQGLGQANFSHKQLHGKSCDQIQEMLMTEKKINWDKIETHKKRGSCCYKAYKDETGLKLNRIECVIDRKIPIFSKDRNYIQELVDVDKNNP